MDASVSSSINTADRTSYITNESTPLQNAKVKDEGFKYIIGTFGVVTLIITVALGVAINQDPGELPLGSTLAADQSLCSDAGNEVFKKGGNSLDVAIAVTICLGVVFPHLTGIGGNGLILAYNHKTEKNLMCLDSWPPAGTIIFPQLMSALYTAHSKLGHKSWSIVVEPAVRIAKEGFPVSESLMHSLKHLSPNANDDLKIWLHSLTVGMNVKSPQLATALDLIQNKGVEALYKGSLTAELQKYFDAKSLSEPSLNMQPCSKATTGDYHLISSGLGSAGPFLLETLTNSNFSHNYTVQELADFLLGKEELSWPLPSGVVVSVMDKDDNYVSIVRVSGAPARMRGEKIGPQQKGGAVRQSVLRSNGVWSLRRNRDNETIPNLVIGLGPVLGSQNLLKDGYILGSLLHRSNLSKINSFGAPLIATKTLNKCEKRIVTGGVDVRDLLQVVPNLLWSSEELQSSVEAPRVRMTENGLLAETHHVPSLPFSLPPATMPYPVINVIQKRGDYVEAYDDSRSR